jgi:hypothetical protein
LKYLNFRNPLKERILDEELQIDKIGYRIRILNKLREGKLNFKISMEFILLKLDSKEYVKKLENSICITTAKSDSIRESCKCIIF